MVHYAQQDERVDHNFVNRQGFRGHRDELQAKIQERIGASISLPRQKVCFDSSLRQNVDLNNRFASFRFLAKEGGFGIVSTDFIIILT